MEWLQTLRWIFKGGEKSLVAFFAIVGMAAFVLPLDPDAGLRADSAATASQAGK